MTRRTLSCRAMFRRSKSSLISMQDFSSLAMVRGGAVARRRREEMMTESLVRARMLKRLLQWEVVSDAIVDGVAW